MPSGTNLQAEQGCADPWAPSSTELQISDSKVGFGFCSLGFGEFLFVYFTLAKESNFLFLKENKLFKKMAIIWKASELLRFPAHFWWPIWPRFDPVPETPAPASTALPLMQFAKKNNFGTTQEDGGFFFSQHL